MREADVQAAFVTHLLDLGWDVSTENRDYSDVIASRPPAWPRTAWRGAERIVAEVKGHTTSPGLDVDTLYGQLLRRMTPDTEGTRYAVVVPSSMAATVTRVSQKVRDLLDIDVWLVGEDGAVTGLAEN